MNNSKQWKKNKSRKSPQVGNQKRDTASANSWSALFNGDHSQTPETTSSTQNVDSSGDAFENPRFKEACEQMQENIKKHLEDFPVESLESSESEDELDDASIIQKTFENYCAGDGKVNLLKTREILQDALTSGAVVCLICIESIKRNDAIWSCDSCFCMLHIACIQKWAKDSMYYNSTISEESKVETENKWCCPKCRKEYKRHDIPSKYLCFCGKVQNPPQDPWIIPHACGQTCEKKLKPFCGHHCLLLCHPGPCPPCPKTVQTSCFCGRSKPVTKRCSNKEWSCNKPCNKLLSCKQHYCTQPCHGGDCTACERRSEQCCLCSREKKLRPCNDPEWKCEKICDAPLSCGNHFCEITCHAGDCSVCPKSGPRPCPCQKKMSVLPCTEEITVCGDTCEKLLECGLHTCARRCHFGDCGDCLQMRVMKCRCGLTKRNVPCCKEIFCDNKCKRKRDCGRHNCNKKCCIGNCPPCSAPCVRTLNCGTHKCQSRCHSGPCFPCKETIEMKCNCGKTKIPVPCGMRKSAVPPRCTVDCKLPSDCHHSERHRHRCHFGKCPPCRKACDKTLTCGHTCPATCHSAVLTKVDVKKKKEGPWDLAFKFELVEKPCPPCKVPIPLACLGNHVVHKFPCYEVRPWSCGRACGRKLMCGNHPCELECHNVGDAPDSVQSGDKCESCERPCEKGRPKDCVHHCLQLCHPNARKPCKVRTKMKCHCQLNVLFIVCNEWTTANAEKKDQIMSCKNTCMKQLACGHRCPKDCHSGPCPDRSVCKKKAIIRCPCGRLKKELPCISLMEDATMECDKECLEKLQSLKEMEEIKKANAEREKEMKSQTELLEFQRKMEGGKKKKRKKPKETAHDVSRPYLKIIAITVGTLTVLAIGVTVYVLGS